MYTCMCIYICISLYIYIYKYVYNMYITIPNSQHVILMIKLMSNSPSILSVDISDTTIFNTLQVAMRKQINVICN